MGYEGSMDPSPLPPPWAARWLAQEEHRRSDSLRESAAQELDVMAQQSIARAISVSLFLVP